MADQMKTVKITPTWTGIAPVIAELLRSKDKQARDYAYGELLRLCKFADEYVASEDTEQA